MLPRGEERAKEASRFQNSLPRPRKVGPEAASLPRAPVEADLGGGGLHSSKVGRTERLQPWARGHGSQMAGEGAQGRLP